MGCRWARALCPPSNRSAPLTSGTCPTTCRVTPGADHKSCRERKLCTGFGLPGPSPGAAWGPGGALEAAENPVLAAVCPAPQKPFPTALLRAGEQLTRPLRPLPRATHVHRERVGVVPRCASFKGPILCRSSSDSQSLTPLTLRAAQSHGGGVRGRGGPRGLAALAEPHVARPPGELPG
jgi:hypothetical protein